jgi:hypothetical protein
MMCLLYSDVVVHPEKDGWKTVVDINYKDVTVPTGYSSNGADIPRILWRIVPPNSPLIFPGVVVHDYLCDQKEYAKADQYFEEILIASNVPKWKRKSIIGGVKFYTKWIR